MGSDLVKRKVQSKNCLDDIHTVQLNCFAILKMPQFQLNQTFHSTGTQINEECVRQQLHMGCSIILSMSSKTILTW
jgi:hypothetical protein